MILNYVIFLVEAFDYFYLFFGWRKGVWSWKGGGRSWKLRFFTSE
jgi:hypothetical protein